MRGKYMTILSRSKSGKALCCCLTCSRPICLARTSYSLEFSMYLWWNLSTTSTISTKRNESFRLARFRTNSVWTSQFLYFNCTSWSFFQISIVDWEFFDCFGVLYYSRYYFKYIQDFFWFVSKSRLDENIL